ncbi:MAG: hypothetical protein VX519_00505 [Myxococcota bacterium]|nr:hypothetical protein [Myxococcota bacterium]
MSCAACEIHEEGPFGSPREDLELEAALDGHAVLRPVEPPEGWVSYGLEEQFYRCAECQQAWHHAQAEAPYKGIWERC